MLPRVVHISVGRMSQAFWYGWCRWFNELQETTLSEDLVDSLREEIRKYIMKEIPADQSGEIAGVSFQELLIVYGNWRARHVPRHPRAVHISTELQMNQKYITYKSELDAIIRAIESGSSLTPHLSRRITTAYEPASSRAPNLQGRRDLDLLVADWGIHHLHLSTVLESDGFVKRTGELLFAAFAKDDAYLIIFIRI